MALKLDESYNGSTLLSAWWQKVKSNFTAVVNAVNANEAAIDKNKALIESEAVAREQADENLRQTAIDLAGEIESESAQIREEISTKQDAVFNYDGYCSVAEIAADVSSFYGSLWGENKEFAGMGEVALQVSQNTAALTQNEEAHEMMVTEYMALGDTIEGKKQDKAVINTDFTATAVELTACDNNEYYYGELASLSLTSEAPANGFASWVAFTSGATATEMDYADYIAWSGDDVADGVFTPASGVRYNIGLWYDGIKLNAVVRGVAV